MMVLVVILIVLAVLLYAVGLPYCINNRKVVYARNKKYFNAPIAYVFTSFVFTGICVLVFGIVCLALPGLNIGSASDAGSIMLTGLGIFAVGLLIGMRPITKAAKDKHKGVAKDMVIASIGSVTALWVAFLPFISDCSQKKYQHYLAEERQRQAMQQAEMERARSRSVINNTTGERHHLNRDGTKFKNADGDWVSVKEAVRSGNYRIVE